MSCGNSGLNGEFKDVGVVGVCRGRLRPPLSVIVEGSSGVGLLPINSDFDEDSFPDHLSLSLFELVQESV